MKILFFGSLGERIGREIEVELPEEVHDVSALRGFLAQRFPDAGEALRNASVRACIDDIVVTDDHAVGGATGEVQFFPPLSGG